MFNCTSEISKFKRSEFYQVWILDELLSPYFALRYSLSAPIGDEGFRLLIGRSVVQIGFIIISASLTEILEDLPKESSSLPK
ncbi:hypothetical protein F8388_009499 [Cannabis sativa]|uniref:Uncharacterized protein n=1 Tax=Cannabis sativa TaxID=3483 RepID=A0A7J6EIP8_CANSA|nr:hypothetical protein F8388_009499 [Cannabis sativa]